MNKSDIIEALLNYGDEEYDHYGMPVFRIDGCEYAIGTDEEADEAVKENIKESVWAFNAEFLAGYIAGGELTADDINRLRGDRCEDCNEALLKLIDDFDDFVEGAVSSDGRGHFLSPYDGEEIEEGDYYLYRVN